MRFDALVVPRGAEARCVERGWRGAHPALLRVPAGPTAGSALDAGQAFATALVLGVCGALDPALNVGDAVVYAEIADGPQTLELDPQLAGDCAMLLHCTPLRAANAVTIVASAGAKAALRASTGAAAVDMEAASIARTLHARGVRVAMIRVVSDHAGSELPNLHAIYDASGALRPLALAFRLVRTPRRSLRFICDALHALAALRRAAHRLSASAAETPAAEA